MSDLNLKALPVLLVDDETHILHSFSVMLKSAGIKNVTTMDDPREVIPFIKKNRASLVVLDLSMPYISGKELLVKISRDFPEIPTIIVTATNEIATAVDCMKNGANDYLLKPVEKNRFISAVKKSLEISYLKNEVSSLKHYLLSDDLKKESAFSHIITSSKKMHAIFKYIEVIADSPFPVLVTGETGAGKELIAKAIYLSGSGHKNFTAVNVAGLDDTMFSDTLFGHKKGAFTGADSFREGLIAQAAGGVLFLDEIGDLSHRSQVKLLRLVQEKEYYQLGSDLPKKTDARIIVATNRDIQSRVKEEKFRNDLYFRLSAHQIQIPPLRERLEDIHFLIEHFLEKAAVALNKKKPTPPPELVTLLSTYDFPGNVRELETLVYDAVSRHESGVLSLESFKDVINKERGRLTPGSIDSASNNQPVEQFLQGFPTLKLAEMFLIERAMERAKGNQGIAASILGITRQALNKRLIRKRKDPAAQGAD
ncbi:MAG: sigma-54-dependent Fis family transcriptional regulator [Candidatus Aminicenantes bacterium]|nr:sigma-54-dependent Fis family transcriptional regulator [Candidatus Aminicenantes bacterium]